MDGVISSQNRDDPSYRRGSYPSSSSLPYRGSSIATFPHHSHPMGTGDPLQSHHTCSIHTKGLPLRTSFGMPADKSAGDNQSISPCSAQMLVSPCMPELGQSPHSSPDTDMANDQLSMSLGNPTAGTPRQFTPRIASRCARRDGVRRSRFVELDLPHPDTTAVEQRATSIFSAPISRLDPVRAPPGFFTEPNATIDASHLASGNSTEMLPQITVTTPEDDRLPRTTRVIFASVPRYLKAGLIKPLQLRCQLGRKTGSAKTSLGNGDRALALRSVLREPIQPSHEPVSLLPLSFLKLFVEMMPSLIVWRLMTFYALFTTPELPVPISFSGGVSCPIPGADGDDMRPHTTGSHSTKSSSDTAYPDSPTSVSPANSVGTLPRFQDPREEIPLVVTNPDPESAASSFTLISQSLRTASARPSSTTVHSIRSGPLVVTNPDAPSSSASSLSSSLEGSTASSSRRTKNTTYPIDIIEKSTVRILDNHPSILEADWLAIWKNLNKDKRCLAHRRAHGLAILPSYLLRRNLNTLRAVQECASETGFPVWQIELALESWAKFVNVLHTERGADGGSRQTASQELCVSIRPEAVNISAASMEQVFSAGQIALQKEWSRLATILAHDAAHLRPNGTLMLNEQFPLPVDLHGPLRNAISRAKAEWFAVVELESPSCFSRARESDFRQDNQTGGFYSWIRKKLRPLSKLKFFRRATAGGSRASKRQSHGAEAEMGGATKEKVAWRLRPSLELTMDGAAALTEQLAQLAAGPAAHARDSERQHRRSGTNTSSTTQLQSSVQAGPQSSQGLASWATVAGPSTRAHEPGAHRREVRQGNRATKANNNDKDRTVDKGKGKHKDKKGVQNRRSGIIAAGGATLF